MKRAFTILELLAATALTAVLMVAVLHLVGSLGRGRDAITKHADDSAWRMDLLEMLRRDLTNATQMTMAQNRVVLIGSGALARGSLVPQHEPVTVTYEIAGANGRGCLVRRQSPRDGASRQPGWSELVCPNLMSFAIEPVSGMPAAPASPAAQVSAWQAIPPVVHVRLVGAGGWGVDELIVLR